MYQVHWQDNHGMGHMKLFSSSNSLDEFLPTLRHVASIKNSNGKEIGEVWKEHKHWYWAYDAEDMSS